MGVRAPGAVKLLGLSYRAWGPGAALGEAGGAPAGEGQQGLGGAWVGSPERPS